MKTVYKYPLEIEKIAQVEMPVGAEILSVGLQHEMPVLWARVETEIAETEVRQIRIAGTGHHDADGRYLGTLLVDGGSLVFHVFDLGPMTARSES